MSACPGCDGIVEFHNCVENAGPCCRLDQEFIGGIVRNRSGVDSGEIDYELRLARLDRMTRRELSDAIECLDALKDYIMTRLTTANPLPASPSAEPCGRTYARSDGSLGCAECCNGDRCDDLTHVDRSKCRYCKGTGSIPPAPAKEDEKR